MKVSPSLLRKDYETMRQHGASHQSAVEHIAHDEHLTVQEIEEALTEKVVQQTGWVAMMLSRFLS